MIRGEVSEGRQAWATIEAIDAGGRPRPVEVVLDTGFTGYLTLPEETIRQLGLPSAGRRTYELANGESFEFEAYLAPVRWHGRSTDAVVLRSDSVPLLGMELLWGSRVTVDAVERGEVSIRELEVGTSVDKPDTPPIMQRILGALWQRVEQSWLPAIGIVLAVVAIAYSFDSIPLDFGEVVTFMGIWLALGGILGQNKKRRTAAIVSCWGFFIIILIAYAVMIGGDEPSGGSTKELVSIFVLSLLSFVIGFFAGQDKEPKQR